MQPFIKNN